MSMVDKLDTLEERLESVHELLEEEDFEAATAEAQGLSEIVDCGLCKNLEHGLVGGIMFAAGMTPEGKQRRVVAVQQEIERFVNVELPAARERFENLEGEPPVSEP